MNQVVRGGMLSIALATGLSAFGYSVTGVSARQHWPWDNKVDVDFTLSEADADLFYHVDILAQYPGMPGDGVRAKTLLSEPAVRGNGAHRIVWDMGADLPGLYTTNLTVSVTVSPFDGTTPAYLVIDLSGGSTATSYPVRYTTEAPDLSTDTCRTTELWLKRCPAGTFTMGKGTTPNRSYYPAHQVKLTQPYYLGVFEVTQEQWYRVRGKWPSAYSNLACRATRPLENVNWASVRTTYNSCPGLKAPEKDTPPPGYFMSDLRTRTGLTTLDLPTEAQWEYACRAGTTGDRYFSGNITTYVRGPWTVEGKGIHEAKYDCDDRWGSAKVGSYPANPWGFYDMIGNVGEFVFDGNPNPSTDGIQNDINAGLFADTPENLEAYFTDPWTWPGRTPSGNVTVRGGTFKNPDADLTSVFRAPQAWVGDGSKSPIVGFRIAVTVR